MDIVFPNGTTVTVEDGYDSIGLSKDSARVVELMGNDCLTLKFSLSEFITFPMRSYCDFEGNRYYLYSAPQIVKQNSRNYEYTMPMYTAAYMLTMTLMRNVVINYSTTPMTVGGDKRIKFPLTATPREHLQMICDCLNAAEGSNEWHIDYAGTIGMEAPASGQTGPYDGLVDNGEARLVSYENMYLNAAIAAVAAAYDTEFEIVGKAMRLNKIEYHKTTPLSMAYGKGNGFNSGIARRNEQDIPPIDKLYMQGGEQNIPEHYGQTPNDDGSYSANNNYPASNTLLLPRRYNNGVYRGVACLYNGSQFYFITNPTILTNPSTGEVYIKAKNLHDHAPDIIYDENGQAIDYALFVPTPCYLVSDDGRYIQRVRYANYSNDIQNGLDPNYTPRGTSVEASYDASEIYPMRVGRLDAVESVDGGTDSDTGEPIVFYDIYDASPDCPNYKERYVAGEKMTIVFQDGMLAGREFDLNTYNAPPADKDKPICEEVWMTHSGQRFVDDQGNYIQAKRMELCQNEQDNILMPGGVFIPKAGDHYIIFHCLLPKEYIRGIAYGAEYRALREMVDYLYNNGKATYTFNGTVDSIWAKSVWDTHTDPNDNTSPTYGEYFAIGQHIRVTDVQLFGALGLVLRVTGFKQPVTDPKAIELTLSNALKKKFDWVSRLSETVREVTVRPPALRPNQYEFPRNLIGARRSIQNYNILERSTYSAGTMIITNRLTVDNAAGRFNWTAGTFLDVDGNQHSIAAGSLTKDINGTNLNDGLYNIYLVYDEANDVYTYVLDSTPVGEESISAWHQHVGTISPSLELPRTGETLSRIIRINNSIQHTSSLRENEMDTFGIEGAMIQNNAITQEKVDPTAKSNILNFIDFTQNKQTGDTTIAIKNPENPSTNLKSVVISPDGVKEPVVVDLSFSGGLQEYTDDAKYVNLTYTVKKDGVLTVPTSLEINGVTVTPVASSGTITVELEELGDNTFVLTATIDGEDYTGTCVVVTALPIYVGFYEDDEDLVNMVASLTKVVTLEAKGDFSIANASDENRLIVALPHEMPIKDIISGNITIPTTVELDDSIEIKGNNMEYDVYRSATYINEITVKFSLIP